MSPVGGAMTIVLGAFLLGIAVLAVRPRASAVMTGAVVALAGMVLGLGGTLLQEDVGTIAWVLTPVVMAVLTTAHTMALFAGKGPLRT